MTYYPGEEEPELLYAAEKKSSYGGRRKKEKKSGQDKVDINALEKEMMEAARKLDFEKAARLRDIISKLRSK